MTKQTKEELREQLSELEHDQWIAWSKDIAQTEAITQGRLNRWSVLWRPYSELTEKEKDQDREWADKVISILDTALQTRCEELMREVESKQITLIKNEIGAIHNDRSEKGYNQGISDAVDIIKNKK